MTEDEEVARTLLDQYLKAVDLNAPKAILDRLLFLAVSRSAVDESERKRITAEVQELCDLHRAGRMPRPNFRLTVFLVMGSEAVGSEE